MKVLVVSNGFPPRGSWGTEFYTRELVHGLRGRGHEMSVLHPVRDGAKPRYSIDRVEESGIPVWLLSNPGDPRKRFEPSYEDPRVEEVLRAHLERERPDLVHFTYLLWGLSVRLPAVARSLGIPSVVTLTDYGLLCHRGQMFDWTLDRCEGAHSAERCARCVREPGPHDFGPSDLMARRLTVRILAALGGLGRVATTRDLRRREEVVRGGLAHVSRFIAPTEVLGETFAKHGIPREKITSLVYSFAEEEYVAARALPPPERIRFGFLGQLAPHKGVDTLIEAVDVLDRRRPDAGDWELVLHGGSNGGRHRLFGPAVLARANRDRVRMGDPFEPSDAPEVFAGFSAIVLPSRWDENSPLSVLQARAVGVPVVATDVAGIAEVVEDGRHGRLVPPGDAEALASALEEVLDGRVGRIAEPGLPLSLDAHLDAVETIHAEARSAGR